MAESPELLQDLLRASEVQRQSGATYRQLDYWARHDVLLPAIEARGSGTARRYRPEDAVIARRLVELSEMIEFSSNSKVGMPSSLARKVVTALRRDPDAEWIEFEGPNMALRIRGLAGAD